MTEAISQLRILKESFNPIASKLSEGASSHFDGYLIVCLNRMANLIEGFISMVEIQNFICLAPILRMQIETYLRVRANEFYDGSQDEFVLKVIQGTAVRNLKDTDGEKLTDRYLKTKISSLDNAKWIEDVYDKTSGYVHLSNMHFYHAILSFPKDNKMDLLLDDKSPIPPKDLKGAINISLEVIQSLINYCNNQCQSKG